MTILDKTFIAIPAGFILWLVVQNNKTTRAFTKPDLVLKSMDRDEALEEII